jgi:hypothetical protein
MYILAHNLLRLDTQLPAYVTRDSCANQQFAVTAGDLSPVLLELNGQGLAARRGARWFRYNGV